MKNLKIIFLLLILCISSKSFSQSSEQYYYNKAAKEYYNGNYNTAAITLNEGLDVYPSNDRLLNLKKALGAEPKAAEWQKYNQDVANIESQGFQKGPGSNGEQKKSIIDPNGVTRCFHKAAKIKAPLPIHKEPTEGNKWINFNQQQKNLLNDGYQQGEGDGEDSKKTLQDPDGGTHYYFKKKIITIKSGFKVASQNTLEWSDELKNSADKITITFKTKNGASESFNVSGKNHFEFQSFNRQFDQVFCKVILDVKLKDNTVVKGNLILDNIWCLCSL